MVNWRTVEVFVKSLKLPNPTKPNS
uniref:Uncharacterized protein n=1 Tax=Rhizophora mucronata TaxID=61149 RepID=A0A2P2PW50_RHIMU